MKRPAFRISLLLAIVVLPLLYFVGREAGRREAEQEIRRLSVIWQDVLSLPTDDRILLIRTSLKCNLRSLPDQPRAQEVADCLQAGAVALDRESREPPTFAPRLEELLRRAARDRAIPAQGGYPT